MSQWFENKMLPLILYPFQKEQSITTARANGWKAQEIYKWDELLQPLRWRCVECVIHHERDVREVCICGANKQ